MLGLKPNDPVEGEEIAMLTEIKVGKGLSTWDDPVYSCPEGSAIVVGGLADDLQLAKDFPGSAPSPEEWSHRVRVAYRALRRNAWIS